MPTPNQAVPLWIPAIQAIAAFLMMIVAATNLLLAWRLAKAQKQSGRESRAALQALVAASIVATPQSAGKTLLRFLRLCRQPAEIITEDGARTIVEHARAAGTLDQGDIAEIREKWGTWFNRAF